jgi:hypothetical protein
MRQPSGSDRERAKGRKIENAGDGVYDNRAGDESRFAVSTFRGFAAEKESRATGAAQGAAGLFRPVDLAIVLTRCSVSIYGPMNRTATYEGRDGWEIGFSTTSLASGSSRDGFILLCSIVAVEGAIIWNSAEFASVFTRKPALRGDTRVPKRCWEQPRRVSRGRRLPLTGS